MFEFIERYKKDKAIKRYIRHLDSYLSRRYGTNNHYTEEQIKSTLDKHKINGKYAAYAYVLYMKPQEVDGVLMKIGESKNARELRKFVATTYASYIMSSPGDYGNSDSSSGGDSDGGGD